MTKYTRLFITMLLAVCVMEARAQSTATTGSPYSRYGLGDFNWQAMPQNIGMGGISTATNIIGSYNTINLTNPAAYSTINYTVIDVGASTNMLSLSNASAKQNVAGTKLSHISFAFPITQHSALGIGLVPYTELGYNYKQTAANFGSGSPADTNAVNYVYSGEGNLSKAYLGYGFGVGKHLSLGVNVSYIFGSLKQNQSTEVPTLSGLLNSRQEQDNHVGGFNFDYGAQYSIDFATNKHLVLGYSASVGNKINVQHTFIVSQYYFDTQGNENVPLDSLVNQKDPKAKIQLPLINHFGIVYQKEASAENGPTYLVGVDYTTGNWSQLSIAGTNQGLQNSRMINIGGQITPNVNAISNRFLLATSYQLGFIYEDTYLNVNNTSVKRHAFTFGLGLPLPHDRATNAFYKVNFAAEIGQRGSLTNGLKENYVNLHLGFTLNDRWFQRYKFD